MQYSLIFETIAHYMADIVAFLWMMLCWGGYAYLARRVAPHSVCLANVMQQHRMRWMHSALTRENRMVDSSIIANLERNISLMASTSVLVIAGVIGAMPFMDSVESVVDAVAFGPNMNIELIAIKMYVLAMIFVYSFFTFTWSLRQFGFGAILIGAMPYVPAKDLDKDDVEVYVRQVARVLDKASHSYNYGIRAYYFGMAVIAWFINPGTYMVASTLILYVLYQREFHSSVLHALQCASTNWKSMDFKHFTAVSQSIKANSQQDK